MFCIIISLLWIHVHPLIDLIDWFCITAKKRFSHINETHIWWSTIELFKIHIIEYRQIPSAKFFYLAFSQHYLFLWMNSLKLLIFVFLLYLCYYIKKLSQKYLCVCMCHVFCIVYFNKLIISLNIVSSFNSLDYSV